MQRHPPGTRPALTATGQLERHTLTLGDDLRHAYLLVAPQTRDTILIDAPQEAEQVLREITARKARVRMILLTHGHADRWGALGRLRDTWGSPVGIHLDDAEMLPLTPNFALSDEQHIGLGTGWIEVIHTPGHTPGSVCFLADGCLFSGDALPVETQAGDAEPMRLASLPEHLRRLILTLPPSAPVFPARGGPSTVAAVRAALAHGES